MPRVLETVLTGRNLLSPVLASAGRDVVAFNSTVARANTEAGSSATASAAVQQTASAKVVEANTRTTEAVVASSARQTTARRAVIDSVTALAAAENASSSSVISANTRIAGAVDGTTVTYQRSAASLREKLGLQALDGAAADRSAMANSRAAQSAAVFSAAIDGENTALGRETATTAANTSMTRANTVAREQASLAARAQQAATGTLANANGLLGTSLTPLTAGLTGTALALAYAGYRGMEFGTAMSQVQAASQASAADMELMRAAAIKGGADTKYSAVEAAQGITEMSKAGVQAKDILGGGLTGALNLAAAGQISVADAAQTGATALSVFSLEGNQMSHVADLLAAGAGKAQGSVGDMSMALNQSALVAKQTGLSIEDTAGSLAMFASNGLIGSDAGTSFKTMLQALTPNSVAASKAMDAIGFSAYDAQGNFVGLESVAGQLRTGLAGLTEEQRNTTLETIFGSDAVRAAAVLYSEGATGVTEWAGKVDDAGYAQRQAAQLTDNLRGDLERLGGAFDSTMTTIGGGAQGALREAVQALTAIVNAGGDVISFFTNLPAPIQAGIIALTAVHLLGGPVSTAFKGIGFAIDVMTASMANSAGPMAMLKSGAGGLLGIFGGPWGLAITGATVGLSLLVSWLGRSDNATQANTHATAAATEAQQSFKQALEATNGVITESSRRSAAKALQDGGLLRLADELDISTQSMTDSLLGNKSAYEQILPALEAYYNGLLIQSGYDRTDATDKKAAAVKAQIDAYKQLVGTQPDVIAGEQQVTEATTGTGNAMGASTAQTEEATKALEAWLKDMQQVGSSFVEPLGIYKGLLDEKTQAERAAAEKTASATTSSSDSWKDYVSNVSVSLDELATKLEEQLLAQDNWRANILTITQRGGLEVGQAIEAMGKDGVQLAALMADGTDAEFQRMAALIVEDSRRGGADAAAELDTAMKVMAAIGAAGAKATAFGIAQQLGLGLGDVAAIAAKYGVQLADGINPVLVALGRATINYKQQAGRTYAGVTEFSADGNLFENHQAEIAPGGAWRVWAEPETGGEAYIPLASSKRDRSMNIWRETGKRLGAPEAQYFAWGGISDVPKPPSTAPYGPPISTAGDATMRTAYDETVAWMKANAPGAGGPIGSGYQALFNMAQAAFPGVILTSGYRPGDPGYHGLGWAADLGWAGNDPRHLADINRWWFDNYGSQLKELIYDGPFDDRPDIKNGVPHTYDAATRADHWTHVHTARANGGEVGPGRLFKVGENGPEWARFDAPGYVYPASTAPAAMPGYGGAGGRGQQVIVIEKRTEIAVDATGYNADQIAAKVVARQHEHEFLTGG